MTTAAIFDLDRTLVEGSVTPVFVQALTDVGIATPSVPGQGLYFKMYERFGEDPFTMRLARHSSRLFANKRVSTVEAAGLLAADVLSSRVLDGAKHAVDSHRQEESLLVLASTSPRDLVLPLAMSLGFDELISTRYRSHDGVYDGSIEGSYIWGIDKAAAVASWAGKNAVDLTTSTAYTDSWYDLPLLELVGTAVVVNPDLRLRAAATVRRWPIRHFTQPSSR